MNRFTQFYLNKLALNLPGNPENLNPENLIPETLLGGKPITGSTPPPLPDPPRYSSGPLTPEQIAQVAQIKEQALDGIKGTAEMITKGTVANQIGNRSVDFIRRAISKVPPLPPGAAGTAVKVLAPATVLGTAGALGNAALGVGVGLGTNWGLNRLGQAYPNTPVINRLNSETRPDATVSDAFYNGLTDVGKDFTSGAAGGLASTRNLYGGLAGGIGTAAVGSGVRAYQNWKKEPVTFEGVKSIGKNMLGWPNQGEVEGEHMLTAANDRRKERNLLAMQGPPAPPEARVYNPVDSFNPNFNPSSNDTLGLNSKSDQSQSKLMAGPQGGTKINPLNSFNPELTGGIQTPGNLALNRNTKNPRPVLLANKTQPNANPGPL